MTTGVFLSPKEERESSMAHLERETHRIRMMESRKVKHNSRNEITARSNLRPLVMVACDKPLPRVAVKQRINMRDIAAMGDERFEWRGPTGGAATVPGTQVFGVVATKQCCESVPARRYLRQGPWGF